MEAKVNNTNANGQSLTLLFFDLLYIRLLLLATRRAKNGNNKSGAVRRPLATYISG